MTIKKLPPFDLKVGYEWMEPETAMGGEFAEDQYWLDDAKGPIAASSLLTTTRSSDIVLPDSAGVFQTLGNDTLPRTDRGLYVNGQLPILNRSSGDFRVSPPANTGWNRSGLSSYENKVSIFEGSIACQLQASGAGSEAFTTQGNILGLSGSYIFDVIIERGTNTLSSFGVGRHAPSFAWVGLAQYDWNTNSIMTAAGTPISTRVTDLGTGPNGGALRRLSLEVNIAEGTAWGLYIYAAGSGSNSNSAIAHYGALYPGSIHSDALFLSPVGSSGTLFTSDIRHIQGVRPSNSQPEPFPGWEAAGLDEKYKMTARINIDRLNSSVARTIAVIGVDTQHKMHVYLDTDNRIKAQLLKLGPELNTEVVNTINGSWTQSGGVITAPGSSGGDSVSYNLTSTFPTQRRFLVLCPNTMPSAGFYLDFGPGTGASQIGNLSNATTSVIMTSQMNVSVIRAGRWVGGPTGTIGPLSVREIVTHFTLQSDVIDTPGTYDVSLSAKPGAYALEVTGAGGSTSTSAEPLPTGMTTLRIGSDIDGANPYNGWIKNVQVVKVE